MSVEQIGFYQLPSDPKLRQKMMQTLENCRAAQIRIKSEQTFVTEALAELAKETGIKAVDLRKVVTDRAGGTYTKTIETSAKYQDLYESLYPNAAPDRAADPQP
ncbi:transcriptional regulator [Salmonella phage Vi01]|uniref:Uncharacterized protein n=9 Tax=Kuttervirus TaxID=2169536 RepID=E1XT61_BPSAV|nr:transcriptional regulator [Salmonella phage Vi01]YP_008770982.1 transcriptional regulator [Salmonella phage Maynard]YP_008771774.1 transcriptional regulator [Salmonella phage Marshall]YP_009021316.1 transcriptional regulator [Salmonella phage vB-SalM-SJ2]YP_009101435.1 transcriptional regulator [Escherichia phage ECML-4]YP_009879794.1 transcriptional regulator [Salmonella phage Mutine]AGF88537.1 hypothetical protein SP063_00420 [Salmonella phage FSL SP-063]AGF89004.1 hypothetical protein 